jgi:hypothetical protein
MQLGTMNPGTPPVINGTHTITAINASTNMVTIVISNLQNTDNVATIEPESVQPTKEDTVYILNIPSSKTLTIGSGGVLNVTGHANIKNGGNCEIVSGGEIKIS